MLLVAFTIPLLASLVKENQDNRQFAQNFSAQQVSPDGDGCTIASDGKEYCCPTNDSGTQATDCGYTQDTSCQLCSWDNTCSDVWSVAACSSLGGTSNSCDTPTDCDTLTPSCPQGTVFDRWSCALNNQGTEKHCQQRCIPDTQNVPKSCSDLGGQCVDNVSIQNCLTEYASDGICTSDPSKTRCCVKQAPDEENETCSQSADQLCTSSAVDCSRNHDGDPDEEGAGTCFGDKSWCCKPQGVSNASISNVEGDLDNNFFVNILDYNILRTCISVQPCQNTKLSDLDKNGTVDIEDISFFLNLISNN